MPCKFCKTKPVWTFTNKQQLCKSCFARYFEHKVKSTIRKYEMPIQTTKKDSLNSKILSKILLGLRERKGKISDENLNSLSVSILHEVIYGDSKNLKKYLPKNQPLYFLSDKEIELYAKIKGINGKTVKEKGEREKINKFIQKIEEKNPDIRHNIVDSVIRLYGKSF
jgi:hypothetical protein